MMMKSRPPKAGQLAHLFRVRICGEDKLNDVAVAIIATEMHFRPLHFRIAEYFLLLILLLAKKEPSLSVGISQISYRYWGFLPGMSIVSKLFIILNPHENYIRVNELIRDTKTTKEALRVYNTKISKSYIDEFNKNLKQLQKKHPI